MVTSLQQLKGMDLLTVSLLETLPIRSPDFANDSLFFPIFARVAQALKNERLLPANDGTFVSAQNATLADSEGVVDLLDPDQLSLLLERSRVVKWLLPEISERRTPDLWRYLRFELSIPEVDPEMFARRLSESFLAEQSDNWFIRFYKFLSIGARPPISIWKPFKSLLRTKSILRLQDGTHVNPPQETSHPTAYLSVGASPNTSVPIIKWEISQDEDAYNFLKALGVQESDLVAEVIETVLPKYKQDFSTVSINDHLDDFAKIERAYKTDSREKKERLLKALRETPFILAENSRSEYLFYLKPDQLYFGTDALRLYFEGNNLESWIEIWKDQNDDLAYLRKCFRSDISGGPTGAFVNLDKYPPTARQLFEDLGILDSVHIQKKKAGFQGNITIVNQHGKHERGVSGFDPHIGVDGLDHALRNPTPEKSAFIWNQIAIRNTDCIKGLIEKSTTQNYGNSSSEEHISPFLGQLLIDNAWLPNSDGNMHKPIEIPLDGLPDSFKKDEQLARKLNMPFSKARIIEIVAPEIGVSSDILNRIIDAPPETIEQIESLLQSTSESMFVPSPILLPHAASFPTNSVSNPDRRKKQILSELESAPDKEYAEKVRSVRTTRGMIDPKTWLKEQYTNDDDQMICQICQEEMPFKYRGENYYFDAVEILKDHFTKEYEAQFLALCPECSPKYRTFIKQVPEAMDSLRQQLIDSDESGDFEIPLKLGDWNTSLRFVERHWLDIKIVLGFYVRQPKQPEPAIEKAAALSPKTTDLKKVISPQLVEKKEVWDADQMLLQHFAQPVRFVTYGGIKDLSDIETSAFDLTGVDSKGRKITLTKFEVLFAFPKEKMSALKPHVQVTKQLKDRSLQPVEGYKNRFQVADKLLRQVKENKSNIKIITRGGYVLSGWVQHFDKNVLYTRVGEKIVVVYRHGLFDFKVEDQ